MTSNSNRYLPALQEILNSNALEKLEEFRDPSLWTQMDFDERELLAMLFSLQGEKFLGVNDQKSLEIFILALRIAPANAQIFYRQGLAWFTYAKRQHQEKCLSLASQNMQKATSFNPAFIDAWSTWANILVEMGQAYGDLTYFQEADEKFGLAWELLLRSEEPVCNLMWDWAYCWFCLGKHSGEAVDFRSALDKFDLAARLGCHGASFWNDYGNTLLGMATLMGTVEWYLKAEEVYRHSIAESPHDTLSWFFLGSTLAQIFEKTEDEERFCQAKECFERSIELSPGQVEVWLRFGQLCLNHGKMLYDLSSIEESLEKFAKADNCQVGHPAVQCSWSEALMLLGSYKDNLGLLKEAESKLSQATINFPENTDIWQGYAACLQQLGYYFNDEDYFLRAIDKYQYGLSLDNARPALWHGLSQSHLALGEMHADLLMLEQASYYCSRAVEQDPHSFNYLSDWAVILLKLAEVTGAKHYVQAAIEKLQEAMQSKGGVQNCDDLECLYHYGCAFDFFGDFEGNIECYEQAIDILNLVLQKDENHSYAKYNLALAYCHLGEAAADAEAFHKAIALFQQLSEEDLEDEQVWNEWGVALLNLAELTADFDQVGSFAAQLRQEAETKLIQAASLGSSNALYNIACLYSLMGYYQSAMYFLEKADLNGGMPMLDEVLQDVWLSGLHQTEMFRHFINQLKNKSRI